MGRDEEEEWRNAVCVAQKLLAAGNKRRRQKMAASETPLRSKMGRGNAERAKRTKNWNLAGRADQGKGGQTVTQTEAS